MQQPEDTTTAGPLALSLHAGLGLGDRLRQRGYDLRSHPVANGTIDCTEAAGELMIEAAAEIDRLNSDRLDMALMVYRLIRRMRAAREGRGHAAGDEALAAKALDYLQRKGLQARPLRADAGPNVF